MILTGGMRIISLPTTFDRSWPTKFQGTSDNLNYTTSLLAYEICRFWTYVKFKILIWKLFSTSPLQYHESIKF